MGLMNPARVMAVGLAQVTSWAALVTLHGTVSTDMDTEDLNVKSQDLANTEESLRIDAGDTHTRIRLLELTLADSVNLTCRISQELIRQIDNAQSMQSMLDKLNYTVTCLEEKLEHYRLYGFSRSAEDE
jgi:hypothetical protein